MAQRLIEEEEAAKKKVARQAEARQKKKAKKAKQRGAKQQKAPAKEASSDSEQVGVQTQFTAMAHSKPTLRLSSSYKVDSCTCCLAHPLHDFAKCQENACDGI